MVLLSAVALVLSFVLCLHSLSGRGLVGCTAGTACNEVTGSRWSYLFGIFPVSGVAVLCYVAMMVILLCRGKFEDDLKFSAWLDRGALVLGGAILGAAVWFIWLQKNMIRAFCPYCMTAHICGIVLSVLLLLHSKERLTRRFSSLFMGLLLAGGLVCVQLLTTPRTAYDRGFIPEDLPMPDPQEMPVVGDSSAEHIVTLLFDYRCSHCQKIHSQLEEVVELLDGEVTFVMAPVPLSRDCNPYLPAGEDRFKGSCELCKYSLALWRCSKQAYAEFDAWLFAPQQGGWYPCEPQEAYQKACSMVGESRFSEALSDSWIENYLTQIFELFGRTSSAGKAAIPRFIYDGKWLVPDVDDAQGLAELINALTD